MSVEAVVKTLASLAERTGADTLPNLGGHFANVVEIGGVRIAIAADGVGTKHLLARRPEDFRGIAIDCVAMNANDLICVGAKPLAIVDYLAIETADEMEPIAAAIADGFADAEAQGCGSIVGGEVAVLPEIIASRGDGIPGLDLAACAIGLVDGPILDGRAVAPGDTVIGIASSGVHSNGFTRLRAILDAQRRDLDAAPAWGGGSLRAQLLAPTLLYPRLMEAVAGPHLHAAANITGGGITNLARVLPTAGAELVWPELPPLFEWLLDSTGAVDAFETFNMGVGFMLVVEAAAADDVLARAPQPYQSSVIGTITDDLPTGAIRMRSGAVAVRADRHSVRAAD